MLRERKSGETCFFFIGVQVWKREYKVGKYIAFHNTICKTTL